MSPHSAHASARGFSAPQQSETEAALVRVLAPSGAPLPDRITRSEAARRISMGVADDITEKFRKQIGAIRLRPGVSAQKYFVSDYRYARSGETSNDASLTTVRQHGNVVDHHRRSSAFGGLQVPLTPGIRVDEAGSKAAIATVGYDRRTKGYQHK